MSMNTLNFTFNYSNITANLTMMNPGIECNPGFLGNITGLAFLNFFLFLIIVFAWDKSDKAHKEVKLSIRQFDKCSDQYRLWVIMDKLLMFGILLNLLIFIMEILTLIGLPIWTTL